MVKVMIDIGKRNKLIVVKDAPPGLYLDAGEKGEILLPGRYIPRGTVPGDTLDVFVYLDSENRLVATTETPLAMVGDFASLEVVGVNPSVGAFLDWGLAKDLLLPFREQLTPVYTGDRVVVYVYLDEKSQRIVATTRLHRYLNYPSPTYKPGHPVEFLIFGRTPAGYKAIVENMHRGLLYKNNLSGPLQMGQKVKGFVQAVRPDGKIDLSLDIIRHKLVAPLTEQILKALEENGGQIAYDDESSPQVIREIFGVSKKAFKQTLGALYKARRINFTKPGIELVK